MALAGNREAAAPAPLAPAGAGIAALYDSKYAQWGYLPEIMALKVAVLRPNTSCESW